MVQASYNCRMPPVSSWLGSWHIQSRTPCTPRPSSSPSSSSCNTAEWQCSPLYSPVKTRTTIKQLFGRLIQMSELGIQSKYVNLAKFSSSLNSVLLFECLPCNDYFFFVNFLGQGIIHVCKNYSQCQVFKVMSWVGVVHLSFQIVVPGMTVDFHRKKEGKMYRLQKYGQIKLINLVYAVWGSFLVTQKEL